MMFVIPDGSDAAFVSSFSSFRKVLCDKKGGFESLIERCCCVVERASRTGASSKLKIPSNLVYHRLTAEKSFMFLSALGAMLSMVLAIKVSRLWCLIRCSKKKNILADSIRCSGQSRRAV